MTWTPMEIFAAAAAVLVLPLLAGIRAHLADVRSRMGALTRVEAKLDLLLKQANVKFDPYAGLQHEIVDALQAGRTIEAIKLYRQSAGVGLKEAKEFIEALQRRAGMG
jgi:hypothetical protein